MQVAVKENLIGGTMRKAFFFAFMFLSVPSVFAGNSSAKGDRLILATYWGDDKVALIDLQGEPGHEEVWALDTLKAAGCSKPYDVRANSRGDEAFVSCSGTDKIIVIDIVAQQVKYSVETGLSPRDLVLFDNGKKLIVANSGSDTVAVVDTQKRKKLYEVSVSSQPYGVAVSPDGKRAIVTGWASGDVHFLDLSETSGKVTGSVQVGMLPYTVILPGKGDVAYVAANGSHHVTSIDVANQKVQNRIKVGRNPWSLAASANGDFFLVTNNRSNNLSVIKTNTTWSSSPQSTDFIPAGFQTQGNDRILRAPKNASVSLNGEKGVFTDLANNQIAVVDVQSRKISRVINVGKAPYGIEFIH